MTPGTRVLLVDDNVELAANIGEILADEGAIVVHAATAREGLELAHTPFDVALVDIRLPDGTGLDLLPKLRSISGPTPEILLITGDATLEDAIEDLASASFRRAAILAGKAYHEIGLYHQLQNYLMGAPVMVSGPPETPPPPPVVTLGTSMPQPAANSNPASGQQTPPASQAAWVLLSPNSAMAVDAGGA